jgi:hypothetical protein
VKDYQLNQSAVLANMQRLRTLRLTRDSAPPPVAEPKRPTGKEPPAGKKSRAKKEEK